MYISVKPSGFPEPVLEEKIPCGDFSVPNDVPDLATLEETKRNVQKVVHEQESFWSWFCYRLWFCDCYHPRTPGGDYCLCCYGCGDCDFCPCGDCDCCANCDCSCCNDCICPADAAICATCCEGAGACCALC